MTEVHNKAVQTKIIGWVNTLFIISGRRAVFLAAVSFSNSPPHVLQGDSGHEQGDGEVTSVPFPEHEKEKRIRRSVFNQVVQYDLTNTKTNHFRFVNN